VNEFEKETAKEIAKQVPIKDIYEDGAKKSVKATGDIVSLVPRAIKAALNPLSMWIMHKEYNLAATEKLLEDKLSNVSSEDIVPPEPYVAVPALQAISYSMDSEELRDMYANLLANSMNRNTAKDVHPAFVEIIKQLKPLDALVFKTIMDIDDSIMCAKILFGKSSERNKCLSNAMPDLFVIELYDLADPFEVSASLQNLERLKLISIIDAGLKHDYENIFGNNEYVLNRFDDMRQACADIDAIGVIKKTISQNNFGGNFAKICL